MDVFTVHYKGRARNFLITVDHYSDYFELDLLPDLTMHTMVEVCKRNFSRHGKPQRMLTDNGSNFVNQDMQRFAIDWDIEHVTSSPYHKQSNGKAESAVKIAKKMIKKAEDSKQDLWLMLLNWRNTPNKLGSSPVSRLFSRSTRCEVPMSAKNLMPCTVPNVPEAIHTNRRRVKYHYDKSARQLPTLQVGDPVFVQLNPDASKAWVPAEIKNKLSERSYLVERNGTVYRRDAVNVKPRNMQIDSSSPISTSDSTGKPATGVSQQLSSSLLSAETPDDGLQTTAFVKAPVMDPRSGDTSTVSTTPRREDLSQVLRPSATLTPGPYTDRRPKRKIKMPTKFHDYFMQ